jgi:hypothetical protein
MGWEGLMSGEWVWVRLGGKVGGAVVVARGGEGGHRALGIRWKSEVSGAWGMVVMAWGGGDGGREGGGVWVHVGGVGGVWVASKGGMG